MPIDLRAAIEHHRQGRLEQAARLYEAALAQAPDHPDTLHLLGLVTLQRGDPSRAAALVSRAIAVRSTEAAYHATLAAAFWALGQLDRTVNAYRSALELQPDHPECHCNLGATLIDLGAVDEAVTHFREAIRLRPGFAAAHNNLANALRLLGDRVSAIEHFRKAVQLDPVSAEAQSNLGEMLLELGQPAEALTHCREAVRLRPDFPLALTILGNVLQELGRLDEAQACFRQAFSSSPTWLAPTPRWGACSRSSATLTDPSENSVRLCGLIPGTPVRWPGWQPASGTSFRMPTGRRSRLGWPTPACPLELAKRFSSAWLRWMTPGASSSTPRIAPAMPMRSSRPTSRTAARPTTRGPIGHLSIACSPRSTPTISRGFADSAWQLDGRSS